MDLWEDISDGDVDFKINENYAKRYDKWRQGEEIQKLKDKYGDCTNSSSSSSEEEDENGKDWTDDLEINFLKTLSSLKERNPKIYDKNVKFFNESLKEDDHNVKIKSNERFLSIGQYQRNILLKNKGELSDEKVSPKVMKTISNSEEELALKKDFQKIVNESDSENSDHDGDNSSTCKWGSLFKKKVKTVEELKTEDDDYKLWLVGEKKNLKNKKEEQELKGIHDFWTNPNLDEGEQFLRDYILNKRFVENYNKNDPTAYDRIVHDSDSGLSADESTLEKQEEFERKYNFRFEEPDQEFIKRFPRTLNHSMRKKDERRSKHREKVKLRKQAEKTKKCEELKRLKALKKKEIIDRIKRLQEITGNKEMGFQSNDLEGDFNPEEHDKRMSELFDAEYYGQCADDEKPEYPELDEELEIENWDLWEGENTKETELHCEDPGFNMDCDYEPNKINSLQSELVISSRKGKRRRRSKFATAIAREKPLFDPKNKSFEKYVDEYYALDYEDIIGDLPCRFKYRKVVPNDYGLTVEEILSAADKELNSWVSIKKIMQRRPENIELFDVQAYRKKAKNISKKQKCLASLYNEEENPKTIDFSNKKANENNEGITENHGSDSFSLKKRSGSNICPKYSRISNRNYSVSRKPEDKNNITGSQSAQSFDKSQENSKINVVKKNLGSKKKASEKNVKTNDDLVFNMSDTRLMSYGINPKKLKNKLKFGFK